MTPAELRAARRDLGLTQGQLANILGLESYQAIGRLEAKPGLDWRRNISVPVNLLVRYMLRDLAEDRWKGTIDFTPLPRP